MYCDFAFSALIECLRAFHLRYKLHGLSATHQKTFPLTLSLSEKSSYQSPIPKVQNLPLKPSFFLQPQKTLLPQHTHLSAPYYSIIPEIKNFYATMSVSTFIPANQTVYVVMTLELEFLRCVVLEDCLVWGFGISRGWDEV